MNRIIKSELYKHKIFKYYLFAAIYSAVFCLLSFFMMKLTVMASGALASLEGGDAAEVTSSIPHYTTTMQVIADSMNIMTLLAVIVAIIVCRDLKDDTLKNVVASGNSRGSIYFGRLAATLITAAIFFAIQLVFSGASSFLYGVEFGNPADIAVPLLFRFLYCLILTLIFYGLSSLIGNMVVSLIVNLFFTQVLSGILGGAASLLHVSAISAYDISALNTVEIGKAIDVSLPITAVIYFAVAVVLNLITYRFFTKKSI